MEDSPLPEPQRSGSGLPDIDIPPQKLGLKVCVQGSDDPDVDIVAIHGIGADPEDTWIHRKTKTNWLKDENMLQKRLPNARIMTFGFNSAWYGKSPVRVTIEGVAKKLLSNLVQQRKTCLGRPIILIGHCFGGIIIQKAYVAAQLHPEDYPGVYDSVMGMIFLGTPHRGTQKTESQAKFYDAILKANMRMQRELPESIVYNNENLSEVVGNFTRTIELLKLAPKVFCFYEERETNVGKLFNENILEFVVDQTAGTLTGHRHLGLPLNHSDLNKFENSEDGNYRDVSDVIVNMAESSKEQMNGGNPHTSAQPDAPKGFSSILPFRSEAPFARRGGIIERLKRLFEDNVTVALVSSSPGSGKTHIAVEYAQELRRENPESKIYWVNGGSSAEFDRSYAVICNELRIDGSVSQRLNGLYQHLQKDISGEWLMILDGVDAEETLKPPEQDLKKGEADPIKSLLDYCPTGHLYGGRVLITTRSTAVAGRMVKHRNDCILEVSPLDDEDAIKLITGRETKDDTTRRLALELADILDRSAAGLELLSTCIKHLAPDRTASDFLKTLRDRFRESHKTPYMNPGIQSIMKPWSVLYHSMWKDHHDAVRLLRVMAILDLQSLPRRLFQKLVWQADYSKLLTVLSDYAMIKVSRKEVCITPVIRLCVLASMKPRDGSLSAAELALSLVCQSYPDPGVNDPELCEVLQPAALAALKLQCGSAETKRVRAQLLDKMAWFAEHVGRRRTSVDYLEQCLELRENDPEQKESQVAETKHALEQAKNTYHKAKQGSLDQVTTATANAASAKLTNGVEDLESVRYSSKRAASLHRRGSGANLTNVEIFQWIFDWSRTRYGPGHANTSRNQFNLALSHDVQGQYEKAEAAYKEASEIMEKSDCLDNSEMMFSVLSSLGRMYCTQGRLDEAETILQNVLVSQWACLGPDHPETLITRQNAALFMQERGDIKGAGAEIKRVLEIQARLLGMDHPKTLGSMCSLALNLRLSGQPEKAEKFYRLVHRQQMHILGEDHADTITTKLMLAELLQELGKIREAKVSYEAVRKHRETLLGPGHDEVRYVSRKIEELTA